MNLRYDQDKNLVHITLVGELSREAILAAFDAAVADSRCQAGMARLWDFRQADLSSLTSETIMGMAQYSLRFPPGINDVKVAFIAGRDMEFGLSRMFEMMSQAKTPISVFRDLDEAKAWLTEEP